MTGRRDGNAVAERSAGGFGGPLGLLLLLVLAVTAAVVTSHRYAAAPSVDFYHYWAVGKAREIDPGLGSPYRETDRYAAAVNSYAAETHGWRLGLANEYRRSLDLTGTPLFYYFFAILPGDYEKAFRIFFTLQSFLFVISLGSLGWILRRPPLPAATLCLVLVVASEPFFSDLRVGNVSTFQLAALTALTAALSRLRKTSRDAAVAMALAAVPVMILLKPNLLPMGSLMGVCLSFNSARSSFRKALVFCVPLAVLLLALPCAYFRSWTVWGDWLQLVAARGGTRLVYPVAEGNFSLPAILTEFAGLSHSTAALLVFASLVVSFGVALLRGKPGWLRECAADPFWTITASTAATLILAPLAWVHYYVLLALPAGWLLFGSHVIPGGILLGAAALLLSSGLFSPVYQLLGLRTLEPGTFAAGAVVLWSAAILVLARPGSISPSTSVHGSDP
jgi:hypothetical protein